MTSGNIESLFLIVSTPLAHFDRLPRRINLGAGMFLAARTFTTNVHIVCTIHRRLSTSYFVSREHFATHQTGAIQKTDVCEHVFRVVDVVTYEISVWIGYPRLTPRPLLVLSPFHICLPIVPVLRLDVPGQPRLRLRYLRALPCVQGLLRRR